MARDPADVVLRMILYYDIFRHPLTVPEIARLSGFDPTPSLDRLAATNRIVRQGAHICLPGGVAHVARRLTRSAEAERCWPVARRAGRLLASFPWVRAVLITGGLSKHSAEPDADVDFLLLVEPGRVWAAKSALQVLRRAMPASARDCFCTNYLLATDHLELDDRNLFTAMELATAIPVHGAAWSVALLEANRSWAERWVPGYDWSVARAANAPTHPPSRVAGAAEGALGAFGPHLERAALGAWSRYWDHKYAWLPRAARSQRFKRRPEIATNHLHDFQGYVIAEFERRCSAAGLEP